MREFHFLLLTEVRTSVKFMATYRYKDKHSISEMCRFFNVSRSGYYDYAKRFDIPSNDLLLAEKIKECQVKCGRTYGYCRVYICSIGKEYTTNQKQY